MHATSLQGLDGESKKGVGNPDLVSTHKKLISFPPTIHIFRYDQTYKTVFILAKNQNNEELQIVIFPNGLWRFINDETR